MNHLSQYFLAGLSLISALAWLFTWLTASSRRAKQWQVGSALLALPFIIYGQWRWPWSTAQLTVFGSWVGLEAGLLFCFWLSLVATWSRRWWPTPFLHSLRMKWLTYGSWIMVAGLAGLFLTSASYFWLLVVLLLTVGGLGVWQTRSMLRLYAQLATLGTALLMIGSLALATGLLDPKIAQWQLAGIHLGLGLNVIALLLALAWAWPTLSAYWLGQAAPMPSTAKKAL